MKKLKWGETPFDKMRPEKLLRECQRMYFACIEARSVLLMRENLDILVNKQSSPYWDRKEGIGGRALAYLEAVIEPVERVYDHENIHNVFFSIAVDLLFPGMGHSWHVCECGSMQGTTGNGNVLPCVRCGKKVRPITWDDMKPTEEEKAR